MQNALTSYQFDEDPVRVVMVLDAPWFVANDICRVLSLSNPRKAISDLDDDEKGVTVSDTLGGRQEMNIISESGMYSLIFRSRKPSAQRFRKWVTSEVLPELRRTGKYQLHDVEMPPEVGSEHDPVRLNAFVATVREGRRLWGPARAREMWIDLGLPLRLAHARGLVSEEMAAPLKEWLAAHDPSTTAEIVAGLGFDPENHMARAEAARLLRLLGWYSKRHRRGRDLVWAWFPADPLRQEVE